MTGPRAAGVRKSGGGVFLIPAGFSSQHPRGMPAVHDDVWIDFADAAQTKWALAMPNLAGSKVSIRVTPIGLQSLDGLTIQVEVRSWPEDTPMGRETAPARVARSTDALAGEHFRVEVPMPGFRAWTYEEPTLYLAEVALSRDGKTLDSVSFRFGMREVATVGGRYTPNGPTLWLRGSNLVADWTWPDVIKGKEMQYLVAEARELSMNSFRTHTQPSAISPGTKH